MSFHTQYGEKALALAEQVKFKQEHHIMKLIPEAQRLFNEVMNRLDNPSCSMYEEAVHYFSDEEKYNILRYLTNMLEAEEEKLWKQIND